MHVLLYTINYPNIYKAQSHIFFQDQAKAIRATGAKVGVISAISISIVSLLKSFKFKLGYYITSANIFTILYLFPGFPKSQKINSKIRGYFGKKLFERYIKKFGKPDIVHVHVAHTSNLPLWIKRKYNIPYVVTEHHTSFLKSNNPHWQIDLARNIYKNSSKNFAVSNVFVDVLNKKFNEDFTYLPNLVDVNFFSPIDEKLTHSEIKFLNVGITKYQKNQNSLIKAFLKAFGSKKNYTLTIAGSGEDFNALNALIEKIDVNKQVKLFGQATRKQVKELMLQADYFVLTSHFETFGVVLIEAMACGLPVLSTKSGGPESIITDNKLGLLCENNIDKITTGLQKLVSIKFEPEYIRNTVIEKYSSESLAKVLIATYEKEIKSI